MLSNVTASIRFLTDSKSPVQCLENCPKIMEIAGRNFISNFLGQRKQVCLPWIPSHVGVPGNETADELAGKRCDGITVDHRLEVSPKSKAASIQVRGSRNSSCWKMTDDDSAVTDMGQEHLFHTQAVFGRVPSCINTAVVLHHLA
ncbi:hypothetical protein TNCV_2470691 [Trichonephila clavipes]|nr:hypothetical protein TNCV_2470691 [Trichonephila clavipes]